MLLKRQKYFFHPVAALFLAAGTARFVHHYQLLDFSHAWLVCFMVVGAGYWLLARHYDPVLSYVFFGLAVMVFYQAVTLKTRKVTGQFSDDVVIQKLNTLAALTHYHKIRHGNYPASVHEMSDRLDLPRDYDFKFCFQGDLCGRYSKNASKPFIMVLERDKAENIWYIDEGFVIYHQIRTGEVVRIAPE